MYITIDGNDFSLSTKLRVAYKVQGQHAHKPYTEIFRNAGDMTIEEQIGIIYASFAIENPEKARELTQSKFCDYVLDNLNLMEVMELIKGIIRGISGKSDEETTEDESGNPQADE